MSWEDFRIFRAVEMAGSLKEAAAHLGCNPATVARRLAALEDDIGCKLFLRGTTGVVPTREAELITSLVARMARTAQAITDTLSRETLLEGEVRIAISSAMATWFLVPLLPTLAVQHPRICVNILCTSEKVDSIREADISIWMGRPEDPLAVARRLARIEMGAFSSVDYSAQVGPALRSETGEGISIIDYAAEGVNLGDWLRSRWPAATVSLATNDVHVSFEAMLHGLGVGAFPAPMGEALPGLVRLDDGSMPAIEVWRVSHRDVVDIARVRVVADFLDAVFSERWTSGGEILSRSLPVSAAADSATASTGHGEDARDGA